MNNILLNTLPIWTTAQAQKTSNRGISASNQQLLGIQKLRDLILELAMRGKLVPQNLNDEPVSELLKRIKAEYKHLSKEGKIKKAKALPNISEDEFPFDLPKGWEYIRLNDLGEWGAGATPNRGNGEYYGGDIPWFKSGELVGDYISESEEFVTELALKKSSLRYNKAGDVLIAMYGATIGKTSILEIPATTNQAVCACTPFSDIYNVFLLTLLKAYKNRFIGMGAGGAQPNISREKIIAAVIALPSLAEQHRIVERVNELMALCDELEKEQTNSNTAHEKLVEVLLNSLTDAKNSDDFKETWQRVAGCFETLFTTEHSIDKLKQTILQLAVMGKLVPQDPTDEPASELLKKIAKEKARLVKEGKIKKQAILPEITEEEKPFELPKGWEWVRLGVIHEVTSSKRVHAKDYVSSGIPFFRSKEIGELGRNEEIKTEIFISESLYFALKELPGFPKEGDFMLASIGASIGNNWICDNREFYYKDGNITKIENHKYSNMKYLQLFINSPFLINKISEGVSGSAYNALTIIKIKNLIYPLPPLTEQQQIVSKVDELFELCESLKELIRNAQEIQNVLAEEIVRRVVN
jgi:type I restriction enzyme, S subunit